MWGRLIFLAAGIGLGVLSKTELGKEVLDTLKEGSGQFYTETTEDETIEYDKDGNQIKRSRTTKTQEKIIEKENDYVG
jgi:hypothetical protein